MNDTNFLKLLQDAQRDPKGAAARKVVKRVLTFINLSSNSIPWGSRERAGEMTKLMAAHRYCGPSSIFYSIAPDDVHNVSRIRWSQPFTGPGCVAQRLPATWLAALQGQQQSERIVRDAEGEVEYSADEAQLQREAAKNPIACAITFDHLLENVRENLLRRSSRRLRDDSLSERPMGIFGRPGPNHDVKECNKRATFHGHGQYHGGLPPALLGDVASEPVGTRESSHASSRRARRETSTSSTSCRRTRALRRSGVPTWKRSGARRRRPRARPRTTTRRAPPPRERVRAEVTAGQSWDAALLERFPRPRSTCGLGRGAHRAEVTAVRSRNAALLESARRAMAT